MTTAGINPTDILARKREESARPAAPSLNAIYWADRFATPEGRAAIFAELMDADVIGDAPSAPATDRDLWMWIGNRMRSARLLQEAIQVNPLAVGAMWAEAMKREFDSRNKQ